MTKSNALPHTKHEEKKSVKEDDLVDNNEEENELAWHTHFVFIHQINIVEDVKIILSGSMLTYTIHTHARKCLMRVFF